MQAGSRLAPASSRLPPPYLTRLWCSQAPKQSAPRTPALLPAFGACRFEASALPTPCIWGAGKVAESGEEVGRPGNYGITMGE